MAFIAPALFGTAGVGVAAGAAGPILPATAGLLGSGGLTTANLLSALGLATQVGQTVIGGIASDRAAKAAKDAALANIAADRAATNFDIQQQRKRDRAFTNLQLAKFGKSGLKIEGTPLDLITETAKEQELDILAKKFNLEVRSRRSLGEAELSAFESRTAGNTGIVRSFGTILAEGL